MKKLLGLFLGVVFTVAFTWVFYSYQDLLPNFGSWAKNRADKSIGPNEAGYQLKDGEVFAATELGKHIEETRHELAQAEVRSAELVVESKNLAEAKKNLRKTLASSVNYLKIFAEQPVLPKDGRIRELLMNIASAIVAVGEPGDQKPFARVATGNDKTYIHIDAQELFGHQNRNLLRVSQKTRLTTLIDSLPKGFNLQRLTIYQATDVPKEKYETRLKSLEAFLHETFGDRVDEIQVRMTKKESIPGHSRFLLELSSDQKSNSEAPLNASSRAKQGNQDNS